MNKILNLTQHQATPDQIAAGVVDLSPELREQLQGLLTFDELPATNIIHRRIFAIRRIAIDEAKRLGATHVMLGGAPYLIAMLDRVLGLGEEAPRPVYAFSRRESVEELQKDGSVKKSVVFKHAGFVGL